MSKEVIKAVTLSEADVGAAIHAAHNAGKPISVELESLAAKIVRAPTMVETPDQITRMRSLVSALSLTPLDGERLQDGRIVVDDRAEVESDDAVEALARAVKEARVIDAMMVAHYGQAADAVAQQQAQSRQRPRPR